MDSACHRDEQVDNANTVMTILGSLIVLCKAENSNER